MDHAPEQLAAAAKGGSGVGLAFFVGIAAGAAAGMLLAPQTGRESRTRLRQYLRKMRDQLRQLTNHAGEAVGEAVETTRRAAQTAMKTGERVAARHDGG